MNQINFEKLNVKNCNKHIARYFHTKFDLTGRKSDFGTKFAQKIWLAKILQKRNCFQNL